MAFEEMERVQPMSINDMRIVACALSAEAAAVNKREAVLVSLMVEGLDRAVVLDNPQDLLDNPQDLFNVIRALFAAGERVWPDVFKGASEFALEDEEGEEGESWKG